MGFALFLIALTVGFVLGTFVVGQILICLRFAIPTASSWVRLGVFRAESPLRRYQLSAAILSFIAVVLGIFVSRVFPHDAPTIGAGVVLATLVAIPGSGRTAENIADFIEGNRDVLDEERLTALTGRIAVAPLRAHRRITP